MATRNDMLNATLALIRGDVSVAREILRRDQDTDVAEVTSKIYEAMDHLRGEAASELLVRIMQKSMALKAPADVEHADSYLRGVIDLETIINDMVKDLRAHGLSEIGLER